MEGVDPNTLMAFVFGVVFCIAILAIAVFVRNPTPLLVTVIKIIIALSAAGIAATVPGFLKVELSPTTAISIRAGGAIAIFVLVFFFTPAGLIAGEAGEPAPPTDYHVLVTGHCGLAFKQRDKTLPIRPAPDGTYAVTLRQEPFTVMLPVRTWKNPADDYPALQLTLSDKPGLFALAKFTDNPTGNAFFWPATGMADDTHGSGILGAESDIGKEHLAHNYIIGPRFNVDDGQRQQRGFYVSAIRADWQKEDNLLQSARAIYMVAHLDPNVTEASNHFERRPIDPLNVDLVKLAFA